MDGFNELDKDKRPPELMIWSGTPEEIDSWLDKVYKRKEKPNAELIVTDLEIEG